MGPGAANGAVPELQSDDDDFYDADEGTRAKGNVEHTHDIQ